MGGKIVMNLLSTHGDYQNKINKAIVVDMLPQDYIKTFE